MTNNRAQEIRKSGERVLFKDTHSPRLPERPGDRLAVRREQSTIFLCALSRKGFFIVKNLPLSAECYFCQY